MGILVEATHQTATRTVGVEVQVLSITKSMTRDRICRRVEGGSTLASPSRRWARRPSADRNIGSSRVAELGAAVVSITVQVPLGIKTGMGMA